MTPPQHTTTNGWWYDTVISIVPFFSLLLSLTFVRSQHACVCRFLLRPQNTPYQNKYTHSLKAVVGWKCVVWEYTYVFVIKWFQSLYYRVPSRQALAFNFFASLSPCTRFIQSCFVLFVCCNHAFSVYIPSLFLVWARRVAACVQIIMLISSTTFRISVPLFRAIWLHLFIFDLLLLFS